MQFTFKFCEFTINNNDKNVFLLKNNCNSFFLIVRTKNKTYRLTKLTYEIFMNKTKYGITNRIVRIAYVSHLELVKCH